MKSTSKKVRMPFEKYYTPHSVTNALADAEYFQRVFDPAAGAGHILDAFRLRGIPAYGLDIEPAREDIGRDDFLTGNKLIHDRDYVTNPPFGVQGQLAVRFIELSLIRARVYGRRVAMLLHADFDSAKTRRHLFADCPAFARKYTLTERIYWANFVEHTERSSTNHAWFVWDWSRLEQKQALPAPTQHWLHAPAGMRGFR